MPPQPASRPAAVPVPPAKPAPAWLRPAVLALTALALFSMFSAASGDADTWFHLRTGAFIVQNHKLPVPDPFSWTTNMGQPAYPGEETTRDLNLKHEWLAQVILYLVYAAGGFPAMVLFRAACLTTFCAIVGWVAWRRTGRFYLSDCGRDGRRCDRPQRCHRPTLPHHLPADGDHALDSGAPPPTLGSATSLRLLGQRPRRLFHGLGAARRLLRRSAVPAPAQTTPARREDSMGGQSGRDPRQRTQSHLLQRGSRNVRVPAKPPAEIAEGVALARSLATQLVQRAALCMLALYCFGHAAVRALRTGCCSLSSPLSLSWRSAT